VEVNSRLGEFNKLLKPVMQAMRTEGHSRLLGQQSDEIHIYKNTYAMYVCIPNLKGASDS